MGGLAVYGGVVGLILCICTLTVVKSGIVTIFVCFFEDPATMRKNHAEEFETLVNAHPDFDRISESIPMDDYEYDDYDDDDGVNESGPMNVNNTSDYVKV